MRSSKQLAIFCVWLLCWTIAARSTSAAQSVPTAKPTLRETIVQISAGSVVEVKLKSKEKLLGRLGVISNDGFDMQYVKADRVESRNVSFQDVQSIKRRDKGMGLASKITLGVLAGFGVVFLVAMLVVGVAGGWD